MSLQVTSTQSVWHPIRSSIKWIMCLHMIPYLFSLRTIIFKAGVDNMGCLTCFLLNSFLLEELTNPTFCYVCHSYAVLQTQDSKFEPWRSEASRSQRLPTTLNQTSEAGRDILFLWNLKARVGFEPAISDFPSRQLLSWQKIKILNFKHPITMT